MSLFKWMDKFFGKRRANARILLRARRGVTAWVNGLSVSRISSLDAREEAKGKA